MRFLLLFVTASLSFASVSRAQDLNSTPSLTTTDEIVLQQDRPNPPRYPDPGRPDPGPGPGPGYPHEPRPGYPDYPYPGRDPYDPGYPYPYPGDDTRVDDLCSGTFYVNASGARGTLTIDSTWGGDLRGSITYRRGVNERIRGTCSMNFGNQASIRFTRAIAGGGTEVYRGNVSYWGGQVRMDGTFTSRGRNYRWSAVRNY